MPDTSSPQFGETILFLTCIIVSAAMVWCLQLSISGPCEPCYEKTLEYFLLVPVCLLIGYSTIRLFIILFPARAESCMKYH